LDTFEIEGGVPLRGEVTVSGAKNAVLPILAATLMADGPCTIEGVPDLRDMDTMLRILRALGAEAERGSDGTVHVEVVESLAGPRPLRARQDDAGLDLRPRAASSQQGSGRRSRSPAGA